MQTYVFIKLLMLSYNLFFHFRPHCRKTLIDEAHQVAKYPRYFGINFNTYSM